MTVTEPVQRSGGTSDVLGLGLWSVAEWGPLRNRNEVTARQNCCPWAGLLANRKNSDLIQDRNNLLIFTDDWTKGLEIFEFVKSQLGFFQKESEKKGQKCPKHICYINNVFTEFHVSLPQ